MMNTPFTLGLTRFWDLCQQWKRAGKASFATIRGSTPTPPDPIPDPVQNPDPTPPGPAAFSSGLDPLFAEVESSRNSLDFVAKASESICLRLGTSTEQLPAQSEDLVRHSEQLLSFALGNSVPPGCFEQTVELIQGALRFIDNSQDGLGGMTSRLEDSIHQIDKLFASEQSLQRAVSPLTYVQTIFKIESATLSHETQLMFQSLTTDMGKLHLQVTETFGRQFQVLADARKILGAMVAELTKASEQQGRILSQQRSRVTTALEHLRESLEKNQQRESKITNITQAIEKEVRSLVLSIQSQDILSQKLSHVSAGINEAEQLFENSKSTSNDGSRSLELARLGVSTTVQAAQLLGIQHDLDDASGKMSASIQQVLTECTNLDRECLCLSEREKLTTSVDGLIQLLLDAMEDVRGMIEETVSGSERAFEKIRPIGGMASNLTDVVKQFSVQIKLIALNAQVQAAHHCSGTGLEVLASSTASLSDEAGMISENLAEGVDRLMREMNSLVEEFSVIRGRGLEEKQVLANGASGRETELHASRDRTLQELQAVADAANAIITSVSTMDVEAKAMAGLGSRLEPLRLATGSAGDGTIEFLKKSGFAFDAGEFRSGLARIYSVASEHEAMEKVLISLGASPLLKPASQDIEFFEQEPSLPEPGPDQIPPVDQQQTVAVPPAESFGENVELF